MQNPNKKNSYNGNQNLKQIGFVINYTQENVQELLRCKDDPIHFIKTYCKIVSLDSELLIDFELYGYQENFINLIHNSRRVISKQARQMGKALDVDTEIPTLNGFKRMGDISVGDTVFDMNGLPTKVTFKSETHNKPTYKITFSDNTEVVSCEDHLWYGYDYHGANKYRKELREFTTKQIAESGVFLYNSDVEYRYAIPLCKPVQYAHKDLLIDPYLLGLWLGDGDSYDGAITILEEDFNDIKQHIMCDYKIRRYSKKNQSILNVKFGGLTAKLKELNLLKNKHIPEMYLQASEEQRRDLLAGLLDTDGTVSNTVVSFTQALYRKELAYQVKELIYSLGYKVGEHKYMSEHPSITIRFSSYDVKSFKLKRKCDAQKITKTSKSTKKQIVDIKLIETRPTQCITVDSDTHTFLCTRNYIVTHNTQVVAAYILWYTLFNINKSVAILAYKADAAMEILGRYQLMYENLPLWMQQGIKTWNKGDVELENGSKVITAATSNSGIRGKSINLLYVDEVAFVPNNIADEFFTSVYPVVSAGETTKIILTSTPMGYNHFWRFWNEAVKGNNGFEVLEVNYNEHPKRDQAWADEQKKILGEIKFNQEVLCHFLGSSHTLISAETIARLSSKPYTFSKDNFDVLEPPEKDHSYFIVVDTSRGVERDYSAFVVIDVTKYPFNLVAKYKCNKISPLLYPNIIVKAAKDYNLAHVLVEINDIGQQVADIIYNDLEYENMIWVGSDTKYGQYMSTSGRNSRLGLRTTNQVKRIGCSTFKSLVEENKLLIFDGDVISEISTFIESKGSFAADEGYHDDLIMPLVLFSWASNEPLFKDLTDANNRKALYEQRMVQIEEEMTPFGIMDNSNEIEDYEVVGNDLWLSEKWQNDYKKFLEDKIL